MKIFVMRQILNRTLARAAVLTCFFVSALSDHNLSTQRCMALRAGGDRRLLRLCTCRARRDLHVVVLHRRCDGAHPLPARVRQVRRHRRDLGCAQRRSTTFETTFQSYNLTSLQIVKLNIYVAQRHFKRRNGRFLLVLRNGVTRCFGNSLRSSFTAWSKSGSSFATAITCGESDCLPRQLGCFAESFGV